MKFAYEVCVKSMGNTIILLLPFHFPGTDDCDYVRVFPSEDSGWPRGRANRQASVYALGLRGGPTLAVFC